MGTLQWIYSWLEDVATILVTASRVGCEASCFQWVWCVQYVWLFLVLPSVYSALTIVPLYSRGDINTPLGGYPAIFEMRNDTPTIIAMTKIGHKITPAFYILFIPIKVCQIPLTLSRHWVCLHKLAIQSLFGHSNLGRDDFLPFSFFLPSSEFP